MNVYKCYSKPNELDGFEYATKNVPQLAYEHTLKVLKGKFPEVEPALVTDPSYTLRYASDVLMVGLSLVSMQWQARLPRSNMR